MDESALIVGLGNPGSKYAGTRHNAGFLVVNRLAERWGVEWKPSRRFRSELARVTREGQHVWLCQPRTYMNLSGEAVGPLLRYYRVPVSRLMVVVDDADLPLGTVRMRALGSSGGHHGLESLERGVGGKGFGRQRVGVGRGADTGRELADYVLAGFEPDERDLIERVVVRAADQLECWLADGVRAAMNRFNGMETNAKA